MVVIEVGRMIPGTVYRVAYQKGDKHLLHEGKYLGREVSSRGDYMIFEHLPFGSSPVSILIERVVLVETVD